jgi:hypothetical protein
MPSTGEKPVLKCSNVVVSSRGIAETERKKIVIFVPADEVQRITLKFGKSAHNPILTGSIGAVLVVAGIFGLVEFFRAMRGYRYELGLVAFGIIGGSMIFDTLKERYFLEVDKEKGASRLVFSKGTKKSDIDDFCNKAREIYQYQITDATKP